MSDTDNLLLELQAATRCSFLSDLHQKHKSLDAQSKAHIMAIPLARYSIQEWNAAASYILGHECRFSTAEEARAGIAASG